MLSDRLHAAASKQVTAWSKYQLPGYWGLLQILTFVGFGIFLVVQLFSGSSSPEPVADVPRFEDTSPSTSDPTDPATSDLPAGGPLEEPADPVMPADPDPSTTDGQGTVAVVDSSGAQVEVPAEAAELAEMALRALFDPSLAEQIPVEGGGTLPAAGRLLPDATVGALVLRSDPAEGRLVFAATTDADGPGSAFGPVVSTVTVFHDGSQWVVGV